MPSVASQILFFFIAAASVLGILFLVSRGEKGAESSSAAFLPGKKFSPRKINPPAREAHGSIFKTASQALAAFSKRSSRLLQSSLRQPRDIFVHTQEVMGRVRGEVPPSVLDKTFDQAPKKIFSLRDVGLPAEVKLVAKTKQGPKIAAKLQDRFEERNAGDEKKAAPDGEEEFWLGILRQNPHTAHPYKKLGEIYLKRGDYKEAQASLAFALKKDPDDREAAALLAEAKGKRDTKRIKN